MELYHDHFQIFKLDDAINKKDEALKLVREAIKGICDYCDFPCSSRKVAKTKTAIENLEGSPCTQS